MQVSLGALEQGKVSAAARLSRGEETKAQWQVHSPPKPIPPAGAGPSPEHPSIALQMMINHRGPRGGSDPDTAIMLVTRVWIGQQRSVGGCPRKMDDLGEGSDSCH